MGLRCGRKACFRAEEGSETCVGEVMSSQMI